MRSKLRSIALLSALVALAVGVSASAASATTLFEWKVKGSGLASGSSKEFTLKSKSAEVFRINVSGGGATIKMTSSNVKVRPTYKGTIFGGKPGTFEAALEFEKIVIEQPANCTIKTGKIVTEPLVGEIVENSELKRGRGVVEMLLKPTSRGGNVRWATFTIENEPACVLKNFYNPNEWPIQGSALVEMSPQKAEATVGKLLFGTENAKNGSEYVNSKGEFGTEKLTIGGGAWSVGLVGEPEMELVSKEVFGAF